MPAYSPFFQTIYDQTEPVGNLGRGTHYSVLRAIVFHDEYGSALPTNHTHPSQAKYHDFAMIWDEDHDTRIMGAIPKIHALGLLPLFTFFGERKGTFTALAREDSETLRRLAPQKIANVCEDINGDYWTCHIGTHQQSGGIINDTEERVQLYLNHIDMLWKLGSKPIT